MTGRDRLVEEVFREIPPEHTDIHGLTLPIYVPFKNAIRGDIRELKQEFEGFAGVMEVRISWSWVRPFGLLVTLTASKLDTEQFKVFLHKVRMCSCLE